MPPLFCMTVHGGEVSNPTLWAGPTASWPFPCFFCVVYVMFFLVLFLCFCMVFDSDEKEKEPAKQRQGNKRIFNVFWHLLGEDVSGTEIKNFPKILLFLIQGETNKQKQRQKRPRQVIRLHPKNAHFMIYLPFWGANLVDHCIFNKKRFFLQFPGGR